MALIPPGKHSIEVGDEAQEILQKLLVGEIRTVDEAVLALKLAGYRKPGELLSPEDIMKIKNISYDPNADEVELFMSALRAVAQAQLDQRGE